MKKLFLPLLLFATTHLFAQAPAITWQNTIGGSDWDEIRTVKQTSDGGYIMGGDSESGISGDKSEASQGLYDYWIIRLDSLGNIMWENTIGGSDNDFCNVVIETADGGFLAAGTSESDISGDKTENNMTTSRDIWLVKLDASGNIVWQNTIQAASSDEVGDVIENADGSITIAGSSWSAISGDKTAPGYGMQDYWVVKIDALGNILWDMTYGGSKNDNCKSIDATLDGGYIIGGYSFSPMSGNKTENVVGGGTNYADYWVLKIDNVGNIVWQNTIGGNRDDYFASVEATADGGYIIGGESNSGSNGDKAEIAYGANLFDYWVVKLTSTGAISWQNDIGGVVDDYMNGVIETADGSYLVAGYTDNGISYDKTVASEGQEDMWLVKLDNTGSIIWQDAIGGNSSEYSGGVIQTNDGGYAVYCSSWSGISGDKTEVNIGTSDFWIVKLEADCVASTEICNNIDDNCNGIIDDGASGSITISAGGPTSVCQGTSVPLSAVYTGTSLQCFKNDVTIPGATNFYYSPTTPGGYTCQVTDDCGSTMSNEIVCTFYKNPKSSITAAGPTTFCPGGSVTLNVAPVGGCTYQWLKNAYPIAGATGTSYVATTNGNYKCMVIKAATGCSRNSNVIVVSTNCKLEDETETISLSAYPNPASDFVAIKINQVKETGATLQITNTIGQIVYSTTIAANQTAIEMTVDVSQFPAGIYNLQLIGETKVKGQQIVVQ